MRDVVRDWYELDMSNYAESEEVPAGNAKIMKDGGTDLESDTATDTESECV